MAEQTDETFDVVVAFDFSAPSELGFSEALRLARHRAGAHLFVLCVGSPAGDQIRVDLADKVAVLRAPALVALMKLHLAPFTAKLPNAPETLPEITYRARAGDAASEIVELAGQINADLIVLGTHGRSGIKRTLLGSVAEHVIRRAGCPVLVVREKAHEQRGTASEKSAG